MNFLHYLLQVNLYLVLFYGFYRVLLAGETFHQANRAYLVAGAALSLFIPVCHSEWVRGWFVTEKVHQAVFQFYDPGLLIVQPVAARPGLTWGQVVALAYGLGALAVLGRFSVQAVQLGRLLRRRSLKKEDRGAFSFFNFLFIAPDLRRQSAILEHERVHVRQLHSADVLLMELLAVVCWFNPVVYAYRRSLRHLHEFLADELASRHAPSKADYALLLFSQQFGVTSPPHPFTNSFFNSSQLKRRIQMLQKPRSRRTALLKYGLSAPLFGLMLLLSSAGINRHETLREVENVLSSTAEVLPPPPPPAPPLPQPDAAVDLSKAVVLSPALKRALAVLDSSDKVFTVVEKLPQFPGGVGALTTYLAQNLKYPDAARQAKVQGKVFVNFIINQDGSVSDINVLKGIGYGCDEEAVRVVSRMPNWEPGKQSGKAVRTRFNIPIAFSLDGGPLPDLDSRKSIVIRVKGQNRGTVVPLSESMPIIINNGRVTYFETAKNLQLEVNDFQWVPLDIARSRYGDLGKNGALLLTTDPSQVLPASRQDFTDVHHISKVLGPADSSATNGRVRGLGNGTNRPAFYILDGQEFSPEIFNLSDINPHDIESLEVLKNDSAVAKYGERARNGVIIITTKAKKK